MLKLTIDLQNKIEKELGRVLTSAEVQTVKRLLEVGYTDPKVIVSILK